MRHSEAAHRLCSLNADWHSCCSTTLATAATLSAAYMACKVKCTMSCMVVVDKRCVLHHDIHSCDPQGLSTQGRSDRAFNADKACAMSLGRAGVLRRCAAHSIYIAIQQTVVNTCVSHGECRCIIISCNSADAKLQPLCLFASKPLGLMRAIFGVICTQACQQCQRDRHHESSCVPCTRDIYSFQMAVTAHLK